MKSAGRGTGQPMGGRAMREIDTIIVHWSATPAGWYAARPVEDVLAEIDRMHRERTPPFRMVGYHCLIHKPGTSIQGREDSAVGAHAVGHNATSLGVCVIGGPNDPWTPEQWAALEAYIHEKKALYGIKDDRILGHRDMPGAATLCPGRNIPAWWSLRRTHGGTVL